MNERKGIITKIYESTGHWLKGRLVARGINSKGEGFSVREIALNDNLQPIIILDDDEVVSEIKLPKNKVSNFQS